MLTSPLRRGKTLCMSEQQAHEPLAWDLVDRLHKALRLGQCKPGEMTRILGVSPATMTNYLSGKTQPKDGMLRPWAFRCGVPFDWLAYGIEGDDNGPDGQEISRRGCIGATVVAFPTRDLAAAA